MNEFFERSRKLSWLQALLFIVMGALVLLWPDTVLNVLVFVLAGFCVVMGVMYLIGGLKARRLNNGMLDGEFVMGLILLLAALLLVLFSKSVIKFTSARIGILIVIGGALQFVEALNFLKVQKGQKTAGIGMLLFSVLMVGVGIVILLQPFKSMMMMCGIALIAMGLRSGVGAWFTRKM